MKKVSKPLKSDDMRPEYDFSGGVRGKYANRFAAGTNVILTNGVFLVSVDPVRSFT